MSIPEGMSNEEALARYRNHFSDGPIGHWYYDNDINMGYGGSILFSDDGTGVSYFWDDEGNVEEPFCWESSDALLRAEDAPLLNNDFNFLLSSVFLPSLPNHVPFDSSPASENRNSLFV